MIKADNFVRIVITSIEKLSLAAFESGIDSIFLIQEYKNRDPVYKRCEHQRLSSTLKNLISKYNIRFLMFISKHDKYEFNILKEAESFLQAHIAISILIPYKKPPLNNVRIDDRVNSFVISKQFFELETLDLRKPWNYIFKISYVYLNSDSSNGIQIFQIGKPHSESAYSENKISKLLDESLLVIPHKGSLKLLNRSLLHLDQIVHIPKTVNICFDDSGYKKIRLSKYRISNIFLYKNKPLNVGPYLPRHYSIIKSSSKYIFLQDSDDISLDNRFQKQLEELSRRELDMIGSHELRIDQFSKYISIVRYPLDVNKSLEAENHHSLFHPTTLIRRDAYLKTKGFSTDLRFGYDTQFLLRAHFYLRIGNVDDFLYIRFRRPNSLTSHPNTSMKSSLREFLSWRRRVDFRLVLSKKLDVESSALSMRTHNFKYEMVRII